MFNSTAPEPKITFLGQRQFFFVFFAKACCWINVSLSELPLVSDVVFARIFIPGMFWSVFAQNLNVPAGKIRRVLLLLNKVPLIQTGRIRRVLVSSVLTDNTTTLLPLRWKHGPPLIVPNCAVLNSTVRLDGNAVWDYPTGSVTSHPGWALPLGLQNQGHTNWVPAGSFASTEQWGQAGGCSLSPRAGGSSGPAYPNKMQIKPNSITLAVTAEIPPLPCDLLCTAGIIVRHQAESVDDGGQLFKLLPTKHAWLSRTKGLEKTIWNHL